MSDWRGRVSPLTYMPHTDAKPKKGVRNHVAQDRLAPKKLLRGRSNVDSERTPGTRRAFRVLRPSRTDGQRSRSRARVQVFAPECRSGPHERIATRFSW